MRKMEGVDGARKRCVQQASRGPSSPSPSSSLLPSPSSRERISRRLYARRLRVTGLFAPLFYLALAWIMAAGPAGRADGLERSEVKKTTAWSFDSDTSVSMPLTLVHERRDAHHRGRHMMAESNDTIATYKLDDNNSTFPISFYYVVEVKLGSPPRKFRVSLDTGTDLLWVQCAPCLQCSEATGNLPFVYDDSSSNKLVECGDDLCQGLIKSGMAMCTANCTTKQVWNAVMANVTDTCRAFSKTSPCTYSPMYGDGTVITGKVVTDVFYLQLANGDVKELRVPFGCGQIVSYPFLNYGLDGMLGLMRTSYSVPSLLAAQGLPNVFAHCFGTRRDVGHGGRFIFGRPGVPDNLISYTPQYGDPAKVPSYKVKLLSVDIGNITVPLPFLVDESGIPTVEFDSGNTITIFPRVMLEDIVPKIMKNVSLIFDNDTSSEFRLTCFKMSFLSITAVEIKKLKSLFPDITLNFENATMVISPRDYMLELTASTPGARPALCIGMREAPYLDLQPWLEKVVAIGANFMRNYLVIYDQENLRIGFSRMQCRTINSTQP